jgi:hypothetical protein
MGVADGAIPIDRVNEVRERLDAGNVRYHAVLQHAG